MTADTPAFASLLATPPDRMHVVRTLQDELLADIPLTRAMGLSIDAWTGASVTASAPLAPNVNDKGCAFGGSLASLLTLAGWALARLALEEHGHQADIYVQDSRIRYLEKVWTDFRAIAIPVGDGALEDFVRTFASRGKARLEVRCTVPSEGGGEAATLEGKFVALAPAPR